MTDPYALRDWRLAADAPEEYWEIAEANDIWPEFLLTDILAIATSNVPKCWRRLWNDMDARYTIAGLIGYYVEGDELMEYVRVDILEYMRTVDPERLCNNYKLLLLLRDGPLIAAACADVDFASYFWRWCHSHMSMALLRAAASVETTAPPIGEMLRRGRSQPGDLETLRVFKELWPAMLFVLIEPRDNATESRFFCIARALPVDLRLLLAGMVYDAPAPRDEDILLVEGCL